MAKNDEFCAGIGNHASCNIARARAHFFMVAILSTNTNLLGFLVDGVDKGSRRRNRDLCLHHTLRRAVDCARFGKHSAGSVHLPIANNERPLGHVYFLN